MGSKFKFIPIVAIILSAFIISGCAVGFYKGRPSDKAKIAELEDELARLREAKSLIEDRLRGEIDSDQVSVSMQDRGLVITFVAEVLFDSGKDKLKSEGQGILKKIVSVLRDEAMTNEIGVEGHTDNDPIKYSGWKSNWELSTARATSVIHFLEDECGIIPTRLSATGYGEYRPVSSNSTKEGKQKNRRVEIIIKPLGFEKETLSDSSDSNYGYVK